MKKLTVAALAVATLLPGSAFAYEVSEFFMCIGSATVHPTEDAGGTLGSLGEFSMANNIQLGLAFTYTATDNIGVELLATSPFRHKVGTVTIGDIATAHHLSPTLMAQQYFGDLGSKLRPYIGAGINYTTFFDNDFSDTGEDLGLSDLSLKDSWGMAGQIGLDYLINHDWLLNMLVWYMDIDTEVRYESNGTVLSIGRYSDNVCLDPRVFMFSTGYRF